MDEINRSTDENVIADVGGSVKSLSGQDIAELLAGNSKFPADNAVIPKPLTAYDFAPKSQPDAVTRKFVFGQDSVQAAKTLRELADKFERGECLTQSARVITAACRNNYPKTILILTFYEKQA